MDRWDVEVEPYSHEEVNQFCVLDENWQAFRRSLLHTTTEMKLLHLRERLLNAAKASQSMAELRRFKVQVDNYIGSLRRGGFLDENLVIRG